jgi:hypothetical protein
MHSDVIWRGVDGVNWPAINIKNYSSIWSVKYPIRLMGENDIDTHPDFNAEWIENNIDAERAEYIWEYVAQNAIHQCESLAKTLFGDQAVLIQDGRMGGWLVLTNWRSMPEEYDEPKWSNKDIVKWNSFSNYVESMNKNFIYQFLSEMYLTCFDESRL